jgi:transmembrane sensor
MTLQIRLFKRSGEPPALPIERALDRERRRLQSFNPETDLHWKTLAAHLERSSAPERRPSRRWILRPAFGLSILALLILGFFLTRPQSEWVYQTGRGEESSVLLSDSSSVKLNHTSELRVERFQKGGDREVRLKGEAFFRVRPDGTPFIVSTNGGTVSVLGTEFNVKDREGNLEVAVLKGRVRVTSGGESQILRAGEMTTCLSGRVPDSPTAIPFPDYPGWLHGKLQFSRTSLASACREIEERFDVRIRIQDPESRTVTFTGAVDGGSAEAALTTLAKLTGISVRHEKDGFTLY